MGVMPGIDDKLSAPALRRGRLLVIDDDPMVARSTVLALEEDHDCVSAPGGREALALIDKGERFDVILCDLTMPFMSGMEVYREMLRRSPELAAKMLFVTGVAFSDEAREFSAQHPDAFLIKPFSMDQLLAIIRARLA